MKKRSRILVVDDEISIRGILRELFSSADYEMVEAPNAEVALVKIASLSFDLIISDIRMAGQSGLELLKAVKKKDLETEVIIMTSHASMESSLEAIRLGAYDFILKPFEELEYVEVIVARALTQNRLKKENKTLLKSLNQKNEEMSNGTDRAERLIAETARFYKISNNILKSKNKADLALHIKEGLSHFSKGKPAILWDYQTESGQLIPLQGIGLEPATIPSIVLPNQTTSPDNKTIHWLVKGDYQREITKSLSTLQAKQLSHHPLIFEDQGYGVISLLNHDPGEWTLHEKNSFSHMAQLTAMKLCAFNSAAHSDLEKKASEETEKNQISVLDPLTQLLNYNYFLELLSLEISRSRRFRHSFTLVTLNFSPSGDPENDPEFKAFLQKWADAISSRIRTTDMATRKTDQLIIAFPETTLDQSHTVLKSLKHTMGELSRTENNPHGRCQWHIESVEYPKDGDTIAKLFASLESHMKQS